MIDDEILCAHGEKMKFKCAQCEEAHRMWTIRGLTRKAKALGYAVVPRRLAGKPYEAFKFEMRSGDGIYEQAWLVAIGAAEAEQDYPDAVETSSGGRVWP